MGSAGGGLFATAGRSVRAHPNAQAHIHPGTGDAGITNADALSGRGRDRDRSPLDGFRLDNNGAASADGYPGGECHVSERGGSNADGATQRYTDPDGDSRAYGDAAAHQYARALRNSQPNLGSNCHSGPDRHPHSLPLPGRL